MVPLPRNQQLGLLLFFVLLLLYAWVKYLFL